MCLVTRQKFGSQHVASYSIDSAFRGPLWHAIIATMFSTHMIISFFTLNFVIKKRRRERAECSPKEAGLDPTQPPQLRAEDAPELKTRGGNPEPSDNPRDHSGS